MMPEQTTVRLSIHDEGKNNGNYAEESAIVFCDKRLPHDRGRCFPEETMKKDSAKRLWAFFILLSLVLLVPGSDTHVSALDRNAYKSLKTFNEVLDLVEKNYVEPVDPKKLLQGAMNGMMKSLDPHSTYMTADMYKELEVETRGSFGGIGIEITILKDILTVVSPIEDTPAFRAGVKSGDQIVRIDGQTTKDMTIMDAVKKLRGAKDTKVTITIMREGAARPRDIELTRSIIKVRSIRSRLYEDRIGYIRIASFQERTADELKKTVKELEGKANPLRGLVLDLRNNPGGLLHQSIDVSDVFLKAGVIVSTKGRTKSMENKATARDDGDEPTCPMVVLVNEGTASAAEIVSGALQDNSRAIVLGMQTFGKGSVQTVIPLEDGSALKLTTAKYYTPKGRSIQAEGIQPDITVRLTKPAEDKETANDHLREKDLKGHIRQTKEETPKEEHEKKDNDVPTDNQLKSAIDILKSWEIFRSANKG